MQRKPELGRPGTTGPVRKPYSRPKLTRYGAVNSLTRSGLSTKSEGSPFLRKIGSDRRLKENVVLVGTHPLGPGLYLFEYRVGDHLLFYEFIQLKRGHLQHFDTLTQLRRQDHLLL